MATTPTAPGERKDLPLGTLIFRAGLLSEEQLQDALEDSIRRGRRLGQVLLERGLLQESDLARLLAGQRGLPYVSLGDLTIDPAATKLLSQEVAWLNHAVPVGFEDGVPVVAIEDPTDAVVMRNVQDVIGGEVRFVVATRSEIQTVLGPRENDERPLPSLPARAAAPPAAHPPAQAGVPHRLVVRLTDGERIELGDYENAFRAQEEAKAVIRRLAAAGVSEWPYFGGRYVRPDSIVSLDLVELTPDAD